MRSAAKVIDKSEAGLGMPITSYHNSDIENVLFLRDATFRSMNLSRFIWQPCQQIESLDQHCIKFIYEDRQIRGYTSAYQLDSTHFRLNLIVNPSHTGKGIGSILLGRIENEVKQAGGRYLQARLLEDMTASLTFSLARGFVQVHTMRGMSLDSTDFSLGKWKRLGEQLSALGFVVTNLKDEMGVSNNSIDRLAQLYKLAREGWPSPDPSWKIDGTIGDSKSPFTKVPCPERFSIMKHNNVYIGFTSARNRTTGTGVHPDYRNQGIATYLKAHDINACIEDGEKYFESSSASLAMQRVNKKLGYRFNGLAEVRLVKSLS